MSVRFFALFCCISFLLFYSSLTTSAKAPFTAKIVFASNRDGNSEIYVMNPDGSQQINLTKHPAADFDPVWSPTGAQILFNSNRDGDRDLYLMDADGSGSRMIAGGRRHRGPAPAPARKDAQVESMARVVPSFSRALPRMRPRCGCPC